MFQTYRPWSQDISDDVDTVDTEHIEDESQLDSSRYTKDTMLTHNRTVAPDRHERAHLLVMGKYGSISYIMSKAKHGHRSQSPFVIS